MFSDGNPSAISIHPCEMPGLLPRNSPCTSIQQSSGSLVVLKKKGKKKKRIPTSQRTDYSLIASCSFLCVFDRKFNGLGCQVAYQSVKLEAVPVKIRMKAGGAGAGPDVLLKTVRLGSNLTPSGFGGTRALFGNGNLGV